MEEYQSVQHMEQAELSFKKSRFIACLLPVGSEAAFAAALLRVKEQFPKATHYCYAVIMQEGGLWEKMSDDGEPSGTAGKPIWEVLRGSGLTNVALIVVRYFGGTLLGTGGLVRAYSDTAKEVLRIAPRVRMCPAGVLTLRLAYSYYNQFVSKCRPQLIGQTDVSFQEQVEIHLHIPLPEQEHFIQLVEEISQRTAEITQHTPVYIPLAINPAAGK